ncbi:unnamed protein product [Brassica rapa subsp. trilocularis]
MKLKRRELVYLFRVVYTRHCFPVYWNGDNWCVSKGQKH